MADTQAKNQPYEQPEEQSKGPRLSPDQKRFRSLIRGAAKLDKANAEDAPGSKSIPPKDSDLDRRAEELFGLLEESSFPDQPGEVSAASIASGLRAAKSTDDYLALLTQASRSNRDKSQATEEPAISRIDELLQDEELRDHATKLIRKELARFRRSQPTVKYISRLDRSIEKADRIKAAIAAQAIRHKKAIFGSDAEAISGLTKAKQSLDQDRAKRIKNADVRTLGFINARRLLDYRAQLQSKGFAETPSRQVLQEKIRLALASGKKVLLAGATGTGKTRLAVYEVELFSGKAEVASGHEAMSTGELYGKKVIATDENGHVQTEFSKGPRTRALEEAGFVFDEADTVNNRTVMRMKYEMGRDAGEEVSFQENGEETMVINTHFADVWTANLQSAKHPDRVEMDPAMLRLFDSLEVGFMTATEVRDLILASLMDPSGAVPLSRSEIKLINRFAEAAEQSQKAYNGQENILTVARGAGKDQLGKIFLDPGRVFTMMKEWPAMRAQGMHLNTYLKQQLEDFLGL